MPDLRQHLEDCLTGPVCVVGVGNPDLGDDGLGMWLAGELSRAGIRPVILAGTQPEACLTAIEATGCPHVLFLDAAGFGAAPGGVAWFESREIVARFPQVSTHKLSLGLLARLLEADGARQVWLLGVQPASLKPGEPLSEPVRETAAALTGLLTEILGKPASAGSPLPAGPGRREDPEPVLAS